MPTYSPTDLLLGLLAALLDIKTAIYWLTAAVVTVPVTILIKAWIEYRSKRAERSKGYDF